jgi:LCP family protein required for cell wall assembly
MVRRRRLKRKRPFIIFCLLLAALFYGGYTLYANDFFLPSFELGSSPAPPVNTGQRLNVLLLGVDAREGESQTRTDTIILASVDPKTKQMSLLSIPRDTRVNIPRHGYDRINSAAVYGGPEMSMKVVSELLGIPIKYYVIADFNGFKNIVDALGGVTLEVEQDMYHYDPTDNYAYHIDLSRGLQRLDGDKALQYVRYRGYAMGDIERTAHQQKFLVALGKEMLQPGTILKLPSLIPEVNKYVKTNLSLSDMMKMASAAKSMEDGNFVAQTLPGRPVDIDGISYWGVDPAEARQMVAMLFRGETTTVRVPVYRSHSESINIETYEKVTAEEARRLFASFPGIVVIDDPANKQYPMPLYASGSDEVFVGRIREDNSIANGLNIWVVADQIRKGAATNTVQIAELLVKYGCLRNN